MSLSPFDDVVEAVRAALNAKRADLSQRSAAIEAALRAYERAVEFEIAESFASEHQLKHPLVRQRAAEAASNLARAVASLPELLSAVAGESERDAVQSEPKPAPTPPAIPSVRPSGLRGKLVIIGAISGREKASALPAELAADAEWIDTERDGVHAVGNLPQRIKQGRVSGIVILDRIVSHKHTEPVVAAAREARVPIAFAGQGGRASLLRAIAQLSEMQRERA
ncbi:MAG TPA: hypothetical protein VNW92_21070 [Polyangiaceae bacterium]|jgi:hypothetical protein|nr:hypothetical protein [Polyangiaceae bacterium]